MSHDSQARPQDTASRTGNAQPGSSGPTPDNIVKGVNSIPRYESRIIVSVDKGYLYCPVPKVANTAWKLLLSDNPVASAPDVHRPGTNFQYLSSLTAEQFADIQHRLFKFVFVRNPYSRLLSAYKNKFEGLSQRPWFDPVWNVYARHIKHTLIMAGKEDNSHSDITFREFVVFVCALDISRMNEHWHPQAPLSCIDWIHYDYVGKFEQLHDGVSAVLTRLNIERRFPSPDDINFAATNASDLVDQYYDGHTRELVREKFDIDFKVFHYD